VLAIVAFSSGSRALAQTSAGTENAPQPFFYPAPPEGFDPVAASDVDLKAYGFPRRPTPGSTGYTNWVNAVGNAKYRLANPIAEPTDVQHRHAGLASASQFLQAGPGYTSSSAESANWSGLVVSGVPGYFVTDGSFVEATFTVPPIGYENCSYAPYMTSVWAGMDGWAGTAGPNDVLQAGLTASACPTSYKAWYEWYTLGCTVNNNPSYPCFEWDVNLPISEGDELYIIVTYYSSSPNGSASSRTSRLDSTFRWDSISRLQ
jgi:hypothetical protein